MTWRAAWGPGAIVLAFAAMPGCSSSSDDGQGSSGGGSSGTTLGGSGATGSTSMGATGPGGSTTGGSGGATSGGGSTATGEAGSGGSAGDPGTECGGIVIPMGEGGPSGGAVDEWTDVTPAGISLTQSDFNNDNYGAQDVLVDPVRPSDLYAFFCHQGVYKSTDYGQSWTKVNTGENGDVIDSGKPWGEAIETNRCRDPNTPPTLYSTGSQGQFWKSTDGGVNWRSIALPD